MKNSFAAAQNAFPAYTSIAEAASSCQLHQQYRSEPTSEGVDKCHTYEIPSQSELKFLTRLISYFEPRWLFRKEKSPRRAFKGRSSPFQKVSAAPLWLRPAPAGCSALRAPGPPHGAPSVQGRSAQDVGPPAQLSLAAYQRHQNRCPAHSRYSGQINGISVQATSMTIRLSGRPTLVKSENL
jgi:hypothetical protein